MNATKDKAVTISYQMSDDKGNILDNTANNDLIYLHGHQNILPALEGAIEGLKAGEDFNFTVDPKDAFGDINEDLVITVGKENFESDNLKPGMQFQTLDQNENVVIATIVEVKEDSVVVDENHPLAGVPLTFKGVVKDVRDATEAEINQGHLQQAAQASSCCSGSSCCD